MGQNGYRCGHMSFSVVVTKEPASSVIVETAPTCVWEGKGVDMPTEEGGEDVVSTL
jgi:hypothetical protein